MVYITSITMKKTTISISEITKQQLSQLGSKGETFEVILKRIIENSEKTNLEQEK
jgi:hypothetical protein